AAVGGGARGGPSAPLPVGRVAFRFVKDLGVPVVLVPPLAGDRELKRVLVAVEGDGESEALTALMEQLDDDAPEIIALHVFAPEDLPMFGDEPGYEREAWADEFLRRAANAPHVSVRLELRVGNVVNEVPAAV